MTTANHLTARTSITFCLTLVLFIVDQANADGPHKTLAQLCAELAPTPYMGWNTYDGLGTNFDETTIKEETDAIVSSGMKDAGYRYVWLDGGWWSGARNSDGSIYVDPKQWPSGMKALADYIHSKGLLAGIYTDGGASGCGVPNYGSEHHEQQDMDTFAEWGFDAVKIDYCGGRSENLDPQTEYTKYREAIDHNSYGRPILLNICNGITGASNTAWKWAPAVAQSWRTSDDIDKWDSGPPYGVLNSLDGNNRHPAVNGPHHWNDPDYLTPEEHGLSLSESRSQFSLWAIMSAPLIASLDLRHMPYEVSQILLNRDVIAIDQDPLGIEGTPVSEGVTGLQIWSKKLSVTGSRAVALFNRTNAVAKMTVRFADTGLTGHIRVRDIWAHADKGSFVGGYSVDVEPHATVLLKLTGGSEIPVITIPQSEMSVSATSFHAGNEPTTVLDNNVDTFWHSEYIPNTPLPQSITIALGGTHFINRLRYLPRNDGCPNGHILTYRLYVSQDGLDFSQPVASGKWPDNTTEKKAIFPTTRAAYIRLEALEGVAGFASAAEINVDYVNRSKVVAAR